MSKLQQALREVANEVGYVQKDAKNTHHRYKYASAEAVLSKVRESCYKHGVAITRSQAELVESTLDDGKHLAVVRLTQTYALGDEEAAYSGLGSGKDSQDKAVMKANTAALKYLLANAFNISWGDDPEADSSLDKKAATKKKAPAKKKAATKQRSEPHPLLSTIAAASSTDELNTIKQKIKELDSSSREYKECVSAWKARMKEVREE